MFARVSEVLLALVLLSLSSLARAEHWPFYHCDVTDETIKAFDIYPSPNSPTGFFATYYPQVGFRKTMAVTIAETENQKHYYVHGKTHSNVIVMDTHLFALLGKSAGDRNYANFKMSAPGLNPIIDAPLGEAVCEVSQVSNE